MRTLRNRQDATGIGLEQAEPNLTFCRRRHPHPYPHPEQALWREADAQAQCYATSDLMEGVRAIQEKRKPAFTMYEPPGDDA